MIILEYCFLSRHCYHLVGFCIIPFTLSFHQGAPPLRDLAPLPLVRSPPLLVGGRPPPRSFPPPPPPHSSATSARHLPPLPPTPYSSLSTARPAHIRSPVVFLPAWCPRYSTLSSAFPSSRSASSSSIFWSRGGCGCPASFWGYHFPSYLGGYACAAPSPSPTHAPTSAWPPSPASPTISTCASGCFSGSFASCRFSSFFRVLYLSLLTPPLAVCYARFYCCSRFVCFCAFFPLPLTVPPCASLLLVFSLFLLPPAPLMSPSLPLPCCGCGLSSPTGGSSLGFLPHPDTQCLGCCFSVWRLGRFSVPFSE